MRTLLCLLSAGALAVASLHAQSGKSSLSSTSRSSGPPIVDDEELAGRFTRTAEELLTQGKTVKMKELAEQMSRTNFNLRLPAPASRKMTTVELAAKYRAGVLIVGSLYKCTKCTKWHTTSAGGFMLTSDGVLVTCYHVANKPENETLVMMTGDGRVFPVKEVLAANRTADIAILKVEGTGFTPLPVAADAPIGAPVRVFSHPDSHYYSLTEGMVSRYYTQNRRRAGKVNWMTITADFAKGSSGGPVLDENGNVVGMVDNTMSIYYDEKEGVKDNLQMVFKNCVPSRNILDLLTVR